jgi:4-amino-4-deoxy-L-arabinose transferase-like glycosyltransferase
MKAEPDQRVETKRLLYASLAFVFLRMIALQQYVTTNPFFSYPISDSELYMQWAESILEGSTYFNQEYHHPPGYAFFLSLILRFSGSNLYAILLSQSLMIAIQAFLVFYCAKRLFGNRPAWTAFFLYSICGPALFYSMKILSETLYTTLVLGSFLCLLRFFDGQKKLDIFLTGLLLGAAIEVRGNAMILFWPALAAAVWAAKTSRERSVAAGLLLIGVALCTVPVLIRNVTIAGAWTPVASNWGENFYFGNNERATGGVPYVEGIRTNIFDQIQDVQKEASKRAGRSLNSLEAQRFWFDAGMNYILNRPIGWMKLEWLKFRRMLQSVLPSGIYSYPLETKFYHSYLRFIPGYGLMFPIWIAGLLGMRFTPKTTLYFLFLLLQIAILLLYWSEERYLLPILPFLMMAGGCIIFISNNAMEGRTILIGCVAALILCVYVNIYPVLPGGTAAWYSNASSAHFADREFREAAFMAREALKQDRNFVEAWTNLGSSLYAQGNVDVARKAWLQAIRIRPNHVMTLRNLAISYEKEDRHASRIWWQRALIAASMQGLPPVTINAIKGRMNELR